MLGLHALDHMGIVALLVWTIAVLCAAPDPTTSTKQVYHDRDGGDSHPADTEP